jgi:hypothetical protein
MSADSHQVNITLRIIDFLESIGISVSRGHVDDASFLPGIEVVSGGLVIDESKLRFPGDLLHEAGHLAVTPSRERGNLSGEVQTPGSVPEVIEVEAMLWSYAAAIHLELDPRVVFHKDGYHGRSESLLLNFSMGLYLGLNGLEDAGMTLSQASAAERGAEPFPVMQKWLKD